MNGNGDATQVPGLRYVSDERPGITRRRNGRGFGYVGPDGRRVGDAEVLARIRSLAIPPAWTDVWICTDPRGHLQATGRDARGRKQYRYHPRWREVRDETKYTRMIPFAEALPGLRRRVRKDLTRPGLPREKVLATVVRLLEETRLRVGNQEYARDNDSYGLTTLRNRHVEVSGELMQFEFRGKGGKVHRADVRDRRLARIVSRCRDLPGHELFQYLDDGGVRRPVGSADVNAYLREATGEDFTAKDFRTWTATVLAAGALREAGEPASGRAAKRALVGCIARVAERLGNTPAICRQSYIHPAILQGYENGSLAALAARPQGRVRDLDADECLTLALLRAHARGAGAARAA